MSQKGRIVRNKIFSRFRCGHLAIAMGFSLIVSTVGAQDTPNGGSGGSQDSPDSGTPNEAQLLCSEDGLQASGALYRICMPELLPWNGDLVVYAHGYMPPHLPIQNSDAVMIGGQPVNLLGFAFATTSYSDNGLAVIQGVRDVRDLVDIFTRTIRAPANVYVIGVSQGGLIATLAVERHPEVFDGGLALCGPIGDFSKQMNYIGDFRGSFDYFFPGLLPGSPVEIPTSLIDEWFAHYDTVIRPVVTDPENQSLVDQLLNVGKAPYDPQNRTATVNQTIRNVLQFNVLGTNDAIVKLGGLPFDNFTRVYEGSTNDAALNDAVPRFMADPQALLEIERNYQTTGRLERPLITMHTTGDEVVPYEQAIGYLEKLSPESASLHRHVEIQRYGHCNFNALEVVGAFSQLVGMVANQKWTAPERRN